jgi:hypothetical protein
MPKTTKPKVTSNKINTKSVPSSQPIDTSILNKRIAELEHEVLRLEQQQNKKSGIKQFFKSFSIFILVTLAIVSLFLLNFSFWIKHTIMDNEQFVATTSPIIKNPDVQQAISTNLSEQIFANVNVEQILAENLPEKATFLAGPLSSQIKGFTTSQINNLLASQQVANLWTEILSNSQKTIVGYLENENNTGSITVNQLYEYANKNLGDSQISFLLNKNIPPKLGDIQLAEISWVPQARTYLNAIKALPIVLSVVFVLSIALAVLLTNKKRRLLLTVAILSTATMLLVLLLVNTGGSEIASQVKPQNKDAVQAVYDIVTKPLTNQATGMLWLFIASSIGLLLIAPFKWEKTAFAKIRRWLDIATEKVSPSSFKSPEWLKYIANNRFVIACTIVFAWFAIFALRIPPTKSGVTNALLASAISLVLLEILSSLGRIKKS